MPTRIYLDHAATTPMLPEVIARMHSLMEDTWGNPSSIHAEGRTAKALLEKARKSMAAHFHCAIGELFFTSGATESNNMILRGAVQGLGVDTIITAPTEHHAVLHTLETLQEGGVVKVLLLPVDHRGQPVLRDLENHLTQLHGHRVLVSLMHANNETGALLSLENVGALCLEHGAYFHSDSVQSVGFYPLNFQQLPVHFLTGSAHKFNGPKGVGFALVRGGTGIPPLQWGGPQERNMRGGTENLLGIAGMALALDLALVDREARLQYLQSLKEHFFHGLRAALPDVEINGPELADGHPKILNLSLPHNAATDMFLFNLDIAGISASGGSACTSGSDAGSHVIRAMYPGRDRVNVRFSFSHLNTLSEINQAVAIISGIYHK